MGCRDISVVKRFSREPGFDSQQPYDGSHLPVNPVPEVLIPFSGYLEHQACMWYIYIHAGEHSYAENKIIK